MGRFSFSSCLEENIQKGNEGCDTDPTTSVYWKEQNDESITILCQMTWHFC